MCDLQLCLKIQFHHSLHERWMFQPYSKKNAFAFSSTLPFKEEEEDRKNKKKTIYRPFENRQSLWKVGSNFFFHGILWCCCFFFLFSSRKWNGSRTWFTNGDYGEMLEMSCLSGAKAENDRIVNENGVWCCCLYCRAEN